MKKVFSIITLSCLLLGSAFAAPKKVAAPVLEPITIDSIETTSASGTKFAVDPRFEVIGIICRFAEFKEFTGYYNGEDSYTVTLNTYYGKMKEHKAVVEAKALAAKGIDSYAMASLAYHLKPDFSGVTVDFSPLPSTLDPKWEKIKTKDIYKFVQLIHDFAVDSKYARISSLQRGEMLNHVGYFIKYFDTYHLHLVKEIISAQPFSGQDVITVSAVAPAYYFSNSAVDENGNISRYTTVFPNCNSFDMDLQYIVTQSSDFGQKIFNDVSEHFLQFYTNLGKKTLSEEEFKDFFKDFKLTSTKVTEFITYFIVLEFLKDPRYIEGCAKDDQPLTYEIAYSYLEKVFDGEYFARGVQLLDDYSANRTQYPSLEAYSQKICEYINSLPTE